MGSTIVIVVAVIIVAAVFAMLILLRLNVAETARQRRKSPQEQENSTQANKWADALVIESNGAFDDDKACVSLSLEIIPLQGMPYRASAVWLVDKRAQRLVSPGRLVSVRVDAENPNVIYPAVAWAQKMSHSAT